MLKNKTKIIAVFLALILLFSTTCVFADNETSADEPTVISTDTSTDEIEESVENIVSDEHNHDHYDENSFKKSDVYLAGDNITIDYVVDGNLFICANTVTISSEIGGDAFICAKNIIIEENGYVYSNLFAIAESVELKGVVCDAFALVQNFNISGGYVYRDLKVACNTLNINGVVGRNAFASCDSINFNTDESTNGIIYGNLDYSASSEISIPENVIKGTVNYNAPKVSPEKSIRSIIADYILDLGGFLAFVLIIWLVCLVLAPKFLANTNKYVGKQSLGILGYGLLALVAVPIACIILILLQLTSGVSLLLLALYILAIILSKSLFTITANNYVCSKLKINKNTGIFGMLILSGIVIWAIALIPYIGGLVSFIISVLGLGILVAAILPKKAEKNAENDSKKDSEKVEVITDNKKLDKE